MEWVLSPKCSNYCAYYKQLRKNTDFLSLKAIYWISSWNNKGLGKKIPKKRSVTENLSALLKILPNLGSNPPPNTNFPVEGVILEWPGLTNSLYDLSYFREIPIYSEFSCFILDLIAKYALVLN